MTCTVAGKQASTPRSDTSANAAAIKSVPRQTLLRANRRVVSCEGCRAIRCPHRKPHRLARLPCPVTWRHANQPHYASVFPGLLCRRLQCPRATSGIHDRQAADIATTGEIPIAARPGPDSHLTTPHPPCAPLPSWLFDSMRSICLTRTLATDNSPVFLESVIL